MRQDTVQMEPTARWTWRLMHRPLINNAHSDLLIHHTHTLCGPTRRCSRPPSAREILAILTLSDAARRAAAKRQSVGRQVYKQYGESVSPNSKPVEKEICSMDETSITQYITDTFADVETATAQGYIFFFYGPDRKLPFATLATQDNDYDRASNLNRSAVFRLNIGVSRDTYRSLFGPPPSPPGPAGIVETGHDFTALDQLLPHPVYAPQSWACVLNPSAETFHTVRPLLAEAYELAVRRQVKREAPG